MQFSKNLDKQVSKEEGWGKRKGKKRVLLHGGVRTPRGSVKRHVRTLPLYGVSLRTLGYVITDPRVRNYGP